MLPPRTLNVLLVDDDEGDLLMIEDALTSTGVPHEIHRAKDGEEAIAFLRGVRELDQGPRPDFVLLDLNMPRVDGRQVLALAKSDPQLRAIPIVVFTTSRSPEDIESSYALHANAYVTKPMTLEELTTVIRNIDDFFGRIAHPPDAR